MKIGSIKKAFAASREKPLMAQNRVTEPSAAPFRLLGNFLLLALIASACAIIITFRDNLINKKISHLMEDFYHYSALHGWAVEDILVEGRNKTGIDELAGKIRLSRSDNILQADIAALKRQIEELPWVKTAAVKRTFFPNTLQIRLHEKEVLALWQSGSKFYPVDFYGKLIDDPDYVPSCPLLVIVGDKAPEKINDLLRVTTTVPALHNRIKAAVLYSGRRWDIIFDDIEDGITVKMPEENLERAWKKFIKINNIHGLLKRKLTFIDLRYKNKLIVTVGSPEKQGKPDKKDK